MRGRAILLLFPEIIVNFVANITLFFRCFEEKFLPPEAFYFFYMQRKFLTNLGLLLTLNFLIKPVWIFAIDRNVQIMTGVMEYGFYFDLLNFSFLFNILLDLGITNFNNRNIAQNNQLLNKHFSSIIVMKFLLSAVYIVIAFLVGLFIMRYNAHQLTLLAWLGFNQVLVSFILYLRSNISGLLMFKTDSFLSVLDRFLMIVFCSILLWGHVTVSKFKIEWFVYAQTAAYVTTVIIAALIVMKTARFRRLNFHWPFFLVIMKQSLPFALLVLLMTFYNRLDPVMLGKLLPGELGDRQVGIYASGFRLLDASNMIAFLFAGMLMPVFSKMIKNKEEVGQMVKLSFTILITLSVIVAFGSIFYSKELMDLMYDEHIEESAKVFRLLMGGFIAVSTTYVFGTLLTARGKLKELNIISAIGLLINFFMNLFLIPELLALGSAYASLFTQFIIAVLQVIIAFKVFRFKVNYKYFITLIAFVAGVVLFNLISKEIPVGYFGMEGNPRAWIVSFSVMILLSLALASVLKLLSIRSMMQILKHDR
jgi:O-antigen/teichoic acid export membrane protein